MSRGRRNYCVRRRARERGFLWIGGGGGFMGGNGQRWERAAGIACALRTWSATIRTLLRSSAAVDHTTDGTSDGKAWSKDSQEGKLSKSSVAAGEGRADERSGWWCLSGLDSVPLSLCSIFDFGFAGQQAKRHGKGREGQLVYVHGPLSFVCRVSRLLPATLAAQSCLSSSFSEGSSPWKYRHQQPQRELQLSE